MQAAKEMDFPERLIVKREWNVRRLCFFLERSLLEKMSRCWLNREARSSCSCAHPTRPLIFRKIVSGRWWVKRLEAVSESVYHGVGQTRASRRTCVDVWNGLRVKWIFHIVPSQLDLHRGTGNAITRYPRNRAKLRWTAPMRNRLGVGWGGKSKNAMRKKKSFF